ncbi:ribokinase [Aspergillus homomorphus CBS 101889]|uniref:Ribokinase n=1 Tax=Aspergillus homomorphus (strain CBS 101889) TaxID=1450537 RepID=A0A395I7I4_ASPHC|nr:Ribokinase-like protein [Aspergillus homomorphus CBS 101889]RAL15876.1 Ribokinase-like protein [Aspergillus homomorphus CBS 101889]
MTKPNGRITIIGSLNTDFATYTPRCPQAGETLTATSHSISAGGKGANQAVACGRASFTTKTTQCAKVNMVGAVGANDPYYSALMRPLLETSGVSAAGVTEREDASTGSATIIVEEVTGENRIAVVPGANHLGMADLQEVVSRVEGGSAAGDTGSHEGNGDGNGAKVVVLQGEIPRDTVLGLLRHYNTPPSSPASEAEATAGPAAAAAAHVVFNPAPVFPEGIPLDALRGTSVLVMNETEAVLMARSLEGFAVAHNDAEMAPEELARLLAPQFHTRADVGIVLITLGAKGAFFSTRSGVSGFVGAAAVEKVVDTTAAGDTFVGYFTTAFARFVAEGKPLGEFDALVEGAVRTANRAAALCVQRRGAMQSIPFAYEVDA